MDYFTKVIYDDTWTFYIVDDDDDVIADENSDAETDIEKKEVYVRRSGITELTARHEMFHVLFSYTYTDTANLDSLQTEEVACELYAYQGKKIDKLAKEVYDKLVLLRDRKDESI